MNDTNNFRIDSVGQINSDNSKVNANALERIEELEGALRGLIAKIIEQDNIRDQGISESDDAVMVAKKALGETA